MLKKISFFSLLLLIVISTSAQNWKPFYKGDTLNYQFGNGTEYLINTLWVDSAKIVNGDSVFYMNRIVTDCDTCLHILPQCDTCYALTNQPQFLMRTIVKKPDSYYQLDDTSSYYIKTNAVLNESWIFDSIHNITATVTHCGIEIIFTQTDSVKTISLSNGYYIKLSKTMGIISFPDFKGSGIENHIIGIENRMLGYRVPNWLDYYNHINIDDVLIFSGYYFQSAPTYGWKNYTVYKTITSKLLGTDRITFNYDYIEYWNGWGGQGTNYGYNCFEILKSEYPNFYNNQMVDAREGFPCNITWNLYSKVTVTNQRKYITQLYQMNPNGIILEKTPDYMVYKSVVKMNIGEYENVYGGLEYYGDYRFVALSHVGITPEYKVNDKFIIYPNPGSGNFIITANIDIPTDGYYIEIYNQFGNLCNVIENIKSEKNILDLTSLSKGLYLCIISNENKEVLQKTKLIIQ